jgi:hypothetical protein
MAIEREEITAAGSKIIVAWEAQYLVGEPLGQPLGHVLGFRFSLEPVALFPSVRDDVLDGLDFVLGKVQGRTEGSKLLVGPCVLPLGKFEHAAGKERWEKKKKRVSPGWQQLYNGGYCVHVLQKHTRTHSQDAHSFSLLSKTHQVSVL